MLDSNFRLDYRGCRALLEKRVSEQAPGRLQLLTGPRQVGKTTLLLELEARLGRRAVFGAGDGPEAGLPGYWERVWGEAEDRARTLGKATLLLDEAQHFADWAGRLKGEWDRIRRRKIPLHVVASGSSALGLGKGSRESLAGRFERITLSHWTAAGLVSELGAGKSTAAELLVRYGSYPGAFSLRSDEARWRAYVRDAIIDPAIGRDIMVLRQVRRPALLRQVFTLCATMPAQIVSLQKLQGQLHDRGALETIAHYLWLLQDAYLVAALEKFSRRPIRRRAAPPKIVVLNNALLAAMRPETPPDPKSTPVLFGAWVENACLAHAWNAGQSVTYWREEPLEVDAVFEGSWGKWAIEVKTGAFETRDLAGLLEFCRRNPAFRPLVITGRRTPAASRRAGVDAISWRDFLLTGLA